MNVHGPQAVGGFSSGVTQSNYLLKYSGLASSDSAYLELSLIIQISCCNHEKLVSFIRNCDSQITKLLASFYAAIQKIESPPFVLQLISSFAAVLLCCLTFTVVSYFVNPISFAFTIHDSYDYLRRQRVFLNDARPIPALPHSCDRELSICTDPHHES